MKVATGYTTSPGSISAGATWRRVDFHLHTPGVESFAAPDGADIQSETGRRVVAKSYVRQLQAEGIAVCALTDYNGVRPEWFHPIRELASNCGIVVLPGAELSFRVGKYGLHVLAVFENDADPDDINRFLQSLDRDPATPLFRNDRSKRDIELRDHPIDALKSLRQRFVCLLIPPHPDGINGLCKTFSPGDAARLLLEVSADAIEHCPEAELERLVSTAILPLRFIDSLAMVEFSDPKRIEEIGSKSLNDGRRRATYLKLSSVELTAVRLALHDPETRLALNHPPEATHARIRSMQVSGSGFLGNLAIRWNDDLNVLIGGRGAGKSAILETLRYALALESYAERSYRDDLVHHALGSGGKVSVVLERPLGEAKSRSYRVDRVLGDEPRVYELDPDHLQAVRPFELLGPVGGPTIFGQREIYAVSGSEEYRLRLLDDLIGEEARQRALRVQESLEALRENARQVIQAKTALAKREEHRQRLKSIEHEISIYEKHGVAEKLRSATALRSDGQALRAARDALERVGETWRDDQTRILPVLATAGRELRKGQSTQKGILDEAASVIQRLETGMADIYQQGQAMLSEAASELERLSLRWKEALQPLEEELNRIKQEAQAEALDPDRLLRLTEECAGLTPLIEELDRVETDLEALRKGRGLLVETVQSRRLEEHTLRRERVGAIGESLGGRLRLRVEFKGQKEPYRAKLASLLKGSSVSADAIEKLVTPEATDGAALARAARNGVADVQARFQVTAGMAERLIRWFTIDETRLFELETLIPPDALRVELRVENGYRPLDRLSVGQRATAVLLLLFALEGRALVLDQPEDDLDNRFVYEDIVTILREQKGLREGAKRRQIIAATHNANIPVLGDAELVLTLEARDGRAQAVGRASIDDAKTRDLIKRIMEGGDEAFRRRAEKYGGL